MKPIRLPVAANNVEDSDTKSVGASPKFFSNMFSGGRHRKSSISGESLGCLAVLDAGEQRERPRAFPSTGEILPTYVKAQPTVHVHRPRAVLSSPENDELTCELQGQQGVKLTSSNSAPKAVLSPSEDLPHAPLSSIEDLPHAPLSSIEDLAPLLSSNEVLKAVPSTPNDLLRMGATETSLSDEAASCSNRERIDESNELSNELLDIKQDRSLKSSATTEKKFNHGLHSESQVERNGNEENLSCTTGVNRMVKKHSGSRGPAKQQLPKPVSKGNSVRVLRPWY